MKFSSLLIATVLLSLVFSPEVIGKQVEKRVVFPKGKATVSYSGKLPKAYADYDAYILKAKKGQTISVKLITDDPNASFAIYETENLGPSEDQIVGQDTKVRTFTGKLPITSEYAVQIYGVSSFEQGDGTGAAYTIEITLKK
jgi:hypothetical protein